MILILADRYLHVISTYNRKTSLWLFCFVIVCFIYSFLFAFFVLFLWQYQWDTLNTQQYTYFFLSCAEIADIYHYTQIIRAFFFNESRIFKWHNYCLKAQLQISLHCMWCIGGHGHTFQCIEKFVFVT